MHLGDIADQILVGRAPKGVGPNAEVARLVGLRDVSRVISPVDTLDVVSISPGEAERLRIAPEDVVVTARGARVRAAVASASHGGVILGANLIAIRLGGSLAPDLLAAFLRHPSTVASLTADFAGTTTAGFTVESLKRLRIHLPSAEGSDHLAALVRHVDLYTARQAQALKHFQSAAEEAVFEQLSADPRGALL